MTDITIDHTDVINVIEKNAAEYLVMYVLYWIYYHFSIISLQVATIQGLHKENILNSNLSIVSAH